VKRIISLIIGLGILVIIYTRIDFSAIADVFENSSLIWLTTGLLMVVPITLITAFRLQLLIPDKQKLDFWEANKLILSASSLNMILPSKAGDFAKAYFMSDQGYMNRSLALSLVIFEKTCDLMSLLVWCAFGLLLYPTKDSLFWVLTTCVVGGLLLGIVILGSRKFFHRAIVFMRHITPGKIAPKLTSLETSWGEMHTFFWTDHRNLFKISIVSVFLWFVHLLQIWIFILAINAFAPFIVSLALSSLAILIGLVPLTFAGIGTRDAALIAFYHPYFSAASGAALGLLCTTRYLMPAISGLPFLSKYMASIKIFGRSK